MEQLFSKKSENETQLEELPGLDSRTIKLLEAGGIFSVEDLVEKSFEELIEIDGIGEKTAQKILDIVSESVDFDEEEERTEAAETAEEAEPAEAAEKNGEAGAAEEKSGQADDTASEESKDE